MALKIAYSYSWESLNYKMMPRPNSGGVSGTSFSYASPTQVYTGRPLDHSGHRSCRKFIHYATVANIKDNRGSVAPTKGTKPEPKPTGHVIGY